MGMEAIGIIAFVIIILIIIIAVGVSNSNKKSASVEDLNRYEYDEKKFMSASNSSSPEKVRQTLSELEHNRSISGSGVHAVYDQDISDLRSHLTDIEDEKWQSKADVYLQKIMDDFYTITSRELEDFNDVELLFQIRSSCLRNWKKYYEIEIPKNRSSFTLKNYMKEYFGLDYDPCLDTYEALEKKLSEYTDPMKPVQARKKKLLKLMTETVAQKGSVKKTDFLKMEFPGYTEKEIQCCYRVLIKKNVITEVKIGSRLFIVLSDKEKAKRGLTVEGVSPDKELLGAKDINKALSMIKDKDSQERCPHLPAMYNRDIERKWYSSVRNRLEDFRKCYLLITKDEYDNLDGELLLKLKKRCISKWQEYYSHDLSQYKETVYPKRYLKMWMAQEYDPCMDDHYKLENELIKHIKKKRPESQRISILYDKIMDYVKDHPGVSQEELIAANYSGYTKDEADCALKDLLKSETLARKKAGKGYVICVPELETVTENI